MKMHTIESKESKDCKLCSLPKEKHLSEKSFGGVLIGCKFEKNLFKSYVNSLKEVVSKWT